MYLTVYVGPSGGCGVTAGGLIGERTVGVVPDLVQASASSSVYIAKNLSAVYCDVDLQFGIVGFVTNATSVTSSVDISDPSAGDGHLDRSINDRFTFGILPCVVSGTIYAGHCRIVVDHDVRTVDTVVGVLGTVCDTTAGNMPHRCQT